MELKEEEAQVCRLCGQRESIYIDVFGEEGTKRLLGLKIHSKINILIDEKDPLPKAICLQCLGKLEFVCDFQEECLRTQQVLRDRYNLPSLTEIAEVKKEDAAPSTSANNNNSIDKNLNSSPSETVKEVDQRVVRNHTKSQRNLRSHQHTLKDSDDTSKDQTIEDNSQQKVDGSQTVQHPEVSHTRWLRSRQSADVMTNQNSADNELNTPIANRLRSHNTVSPDNNINCRNNTNENVEKQSGKQQDSHTIQIPTTALNKLLTIVSGSPNIEVSVKESRNRHNDAEDISFTVELCRKMCDSIATVRAKVFPDQGSCLVDTAIVDLLENHNSVEANSIISSIISGNSKNNSIKLKDLTEFEQRLENSQNPEELFRIDGEEIRVDDNVEHIVADNQNGYVCKLCKKFYERKDKCTVHVKTHLGIKQYTCILCNAKFVCKSDVMKHIRCSHTNPRPIQCPKCPKRFKSKFYLTEHDNVHKGIRPYSCTECEQSYHHKVSLQIHRKSHLPPQNLACEYCGKVFPYRTRLLSHIASVHLKNRRNFRCRFCYNLYSSLSVLNEHIKTRHATTYTCEICSKTFKVASKYKAHVLQHSNPKPFICNVCNNRYASKAFLNEHLLKHEGLRKHICQKCGATFAQASHLAAHRHVHGEKTHACPECGRKFNRRDNMKVHRKRHFEIKKTDNKQKTISTTDETSSASNEKIQKDDGLPQIVCVRCLGTLEFLCDFYDLCHHTQKKLTNKIETVKDVIDVVHMENDAEFDKENAFPSPRKCHQSSSYKNRSKSELDQSNVCSIENLNSFVTVKQSNIKETELNEKRNCSNVTKLEKSFSSKEEPFIKISQISSINVKIDKSKLSNQSEKKNRTRKATLRETRSEDNQTHSSLIKKTRRKSSVHKSLIDSFNLKRLNNVKESRVILSHDDTNTTKADILSISNTKDSSKEFSINENQSIAHSNKTEEVLSNKIHDNNKNNVDNNNMHEKKKNNLSKKVKCHSNENNIKNENSDHVIPHKVQVLQSNQFVWASNDTLLQEPYKPKSEKDETVLNTSPPPGDEAESNQQVDANSIVNHIHISEVVPISKSIRNKCLAEQVQTEVSNSSLDVPNEVKLSRKKIQHNCEKDITPGTSQQLEFKNNLNERLRRNGKFGKISELISHEQKVEIEKYYKIDMSVVDSSIVEKNLTITDKRTIQCNICGLMYPRLDKCQVHIWAHLKMRPYKCTACEFSTVTISNVRCHIRKRHLKIKPFACHLCEKRYVTAVLLEEHLNTHTGARPFKCKICDFASCSRQVLSYHNTTHKPVKDIHCNVCGKEFYSRGRMRAHMLIHNKDKVVMCKLCSAYLSNETALEQHMKNIHTRDYICNICGKILKSRKTLLNHKNVHAAAKYKCDLCPNVYKSSHILKEHLLKHEGIRKYKCNNCEKSFAQQSHLAAHMAVHSEIRYHCPGCNKAFNRRDNMKIHTKRCKSFLANPELKDLLKNKGRTKYIRKINDHVTLDTSMNTNKETFTNTDKETSRNTDNESNKLLILKYEETANNVIPKDINKENDSNNQQNISQYVYNENVQSNETIRSLEKMIELSGSSTENTYDIIPENSTVIQNVLHSDCF